MSRQRVVRSLRGADVAIVHAGARQPLIDRRQLPLVVVGRDQPALALHHRRQRQGLAAGAGAEIDHLLAGLCGRQQRRQLRALVLHLDRALDEILLGMDAGIAGVGAEFDAQAERRPWRRLHAEMGQRGQHLLAFGLQGVDAQIERRPARHRGRLGDAVVAEHLRQIAVEPFRIIAGDMRRRLGQRPRCQRRPFAVGQRLRRKPARRRTGRRWRRHRACAPASACRARGPAAYRRP